MIPVAILFVQACACSFIVLLIFELFLRFAVCFGCPDLSLRFFMKRGLRNGANAAEELY